MNISNWIKEELYPSLYDSIDIALPEFNFKKKGKNWVSGNKLKITGEEGDSIGKVYVWETAPAFIKDFTRDTLSIVSYVMQRDNAVFIDAVKTLADIVGLQIPKGDFNEGDYIKQKDKNTILEDCNSYFVYSLKNPLSASCVEYNSQTHDVKNYLSGRGYSDSDIESMELGCINADGELYQYLLNKGHNLEDIKETINISDNRICSTHLLTIPYRSGGYIKGFKFRTIGGDTPKYLNSKGLDKSGGFFNISGVKGNKDVVIVEGELDSLSASIRGVENVVSSGGSSINSEQIKDAIRKGAKSFTICFDRETGKEDKTISDIERAIEVILAEGVNNIYIVTLPKLEGSKTDPDSLIKERGVEAFKDAITKAVAYWEFKIQNIIDKYGTLQSERELQARDVDSLLGEVIETASQIPDATDRDRYKELFLSIEPIKELGISKESLSITVDRLTATRDKERQSKDFGSLILKATELHKKGEISKALELLDNKVKEVKLQDKATEFSVLRKPIKEEELRNRLVNKPESLTSGLSFEGEPLLLPSGAISIFTAPTSHGKTTLLLNLALNVAKQKKETYFFSYEEDSDSIVLKALNIHLDRELSKNNKRSIESYFTTDSTDYMSEGVRNTFKEDKDKFFTEFIEDRKLNINYTNYDSDTLIDAIRYLHKNANPQAIFIDYIQLLNLPKGKYKTYSRQEELKEICIALKDVAVETGLPIILGAQFNREVVNALRMHSTKIGEAGDIERIANLIVGFWNGAFKPQGDKGEIDELNAKAIKGNNIYATILKHRGGRVGLNELLSFNGNTGKIKNSGITSNNSTPFQRAKNQ